MGGSYFDFSNTIQLRSLNSAILNIPYFTQKAMMENRKHLGKIKADRVLNPVSLRNNLMSKIRL